MSFQKLSQRGALHWSMLLPVLVFAVVAVVGVRALSTSHADPLTLAKNDAYGCKIIGKFKFPISGGVVDTHPKISYGSTGGCVEELQLLLNNELIFSSSTCKPLTVNGSFGSSTETMVEDWQKVASLELSPGKITKLTVNGVVDKDTWKSIDPAISGQTYGKGGGGPNPCFVVSIRS